MESKRNAIHPPDFPFKAAAVMMGLVVTATLAFGAHAADDGGKTVIAHRGAPGYLPEHTLEGYAMAYGQGADYLEPDLMLTKDGVPIALHDRTLNATTNVAEVFPDRARDDGRHYAIDFTLEEIKQLAVRERVHPGSGELAHPGRFPDTHEELVFRIPALAELIELAQGMNQASGRNVGIYPEIKGSSWHAEQGHDFERIVMEVLSEYGYESASDPVLVQSFEPESLRRLRELGCELRLVQLIGGGADADPMVTPEGLDEIAEYADGIGPSISRIIDSAGDLIDDNALISRAHARDLVVHPWTVRGDGLPSHTESAEALLERLLFNLGADGVFIDQPDIAVAFLRARSER
ncbi:MAG: glycerophosphodiester phosphodiesterase [Candidatus Hydrogenedentota bacterium]